MLCISLELRQIVSLETFFFFFFVLGSLTGMVLHFRSSHLKPKNERGHFENYLGCPFSLMYGFVLYCIFKFEAG